MRITIVYPLDHTTPDPAGINPAEYRRRFLTEIGAEPDDVGLQKVHQLTTEGWAAWWSVVVSGCLS